MWTSYRHPARLAAIPSCPVKAICMPCGSKVLKSFLRAESRRLTEAGLGKTPGFCEWKTLSKICGELQNLHGRCVTELRGIPLRSFYESGTLGVEEWVSG